MNNSQNSGFTAEKDKIINNTNYGSSKSQKR